ncbi:MAG: creatininase family protein [Chloroflexota bacterium]
MSVWLHEMKWPEVAEYLKTNDTALVPVGSIEQHGPHLPLVTDAAEAATVAEEAAKRTGTLATPVLWFGWSPHHLAFPGSITLGAETLVRVVEDICTSLVYHGFRKIVIVNGHRIANLPPLEIAQTRLRNRTGAYVAIVDVMLSARKEMEAICAGQPGAIGHACEVETSHMLYTHPHLVDMSLAVANVHTPDAKYSPHFAPLDPYQDKDMVGLKTTIEEYGARQRPLGTGGDPTLASAEKGRLIFEAIVANTVEIVERVKAETVTLKAFEPPL